MTMPSSAALLSPANGAAVLSPLSITWEVSPDDDRHELAVGSAPGGADVYAFTFSGADDGVSLSGLPEGTLYLTLRTVYTNGVEDDVSSRSVTLQSSDASAEPPPAMQAGEVSEAFLAAVDELFVELDPEIFALIVVGNLMGLAIGMGGGWMIRAIRSAG